MAIRQLPWDATGDRSRVARQPRPLLTRAAIGLAPVGTLLTDDEVQVGQEEAAMDVRPLCGDQRLEPRLPVHPALQRAQAEKAFLPQMQATDDIEAGRVRHRDVELVIAQDRKSVV